MGETIKKQGTGELWIKKWNDYSQTQRSEHSGTSPSLVITKDFRRQLKRNKSIQEVNIKDDVLIITTKSLMSCWNDIWYKIGQYEISIKSDLMNPMYIVFKKVKNLSSYYPHPHVSSGHGCMGEFFKPIQADILGGRLMSVINGCISFLSESISNGNEDDSYVNYDNWFALLVKQQEKERQKEKEERAKTKNKKK